MRSPLSEYKKKETERGKQYRRRSTFFLPNCPPSFAFGSIALDTPTVDAVLRCSGTYVTCSVSPAVGTPSACTRHAHTPGDSGPQGSRGWHGVQDTGQRLAGISSCATHAAAYNSNPFSPPFLTSLLTPVAIRSTSSRRSGTLETLRRRLHGLGWVIWTTKT